MDERALIFNIQKFSLHDGPGIRTTVFIKGCPLRCRWCANPESQSARMQLLYDRAKCLSCGRCASGCPARAIRLTEEGVHIDEAACIRCGSCASGCPGGALSVEGKPMAVDEVLRVCMQDQLFYEESGGGVTLSGGEPLSHPAFALSLLTALKQKGVHTAVETTGCVEPEVFDRVTAQADLLLFDVKHPDAERHRWGTGVDNRQIIANLRRAIAAGKDVLPRIPVIPGFNDGMDDARQFASLLNGVGARRAQLLPFHQFGEKKYALLGRDYDMSNVKPLHEEDLISFRQIFLDAGLDCFF
ncbi:MAG: glycyl-radical enzyme activating protein [Clostridia bacterium]|nr:glycyl-radical enzyme activating protein [Clostridia bacterium]